MQIWINKFKINISNIIRLGILMIFGSIFIIIIMLTTNSFNKIFHPHKATSTPTKIIFYTKQGLINDLQKKLNPNHFSEAIFYKNDHYEINESLFESLYLQEFASFAKNSHLFVDKNEKIKLDYYYFNDGDKLNQEVKYDVHVWNYHYTFDLYYQWTK